VELSNEDVAELVRATKPVHQQRMRFFEIMRRHVREEDKELTDREFVRTVYERWERSLLDYIVDVNE
jgi:hypothetical protein